MKKDERIGFRRLSLWMKFAAIGGLIVVGYLIMLVLAFFVGVGLGVAGVW